MKSTEMCKMEKGEYSYLLNEDDVKPLAVRPRSFSWSRCLCRTFGILVVLFLLLGTILATGTYFWMRHQVRRFTVVGAEEHLPHPPLPVTPLPEARLEILKDRAKLFWDQLRAGELPAQDLVVTQDELNGLIASSEYLRGHAHVTLSADQWDTELALPAEGLPGGKGRFFVGHGVVTTWTDDATDAETTHFGTELTPKHPISGIQFATILSGKYTAYRNDDDAAVVEVDYGQFLNWIVPQEWIDRRENLLDCATYDSSDSSDSSDDEDKIECDEFTSALSLLEGIYLKDGQMVFTPRRHNMDETIEDGGARRRHHRRLTSGKMGETEASTPSWRGALFQRVLRTVV